MAAEKLLFSKVNFSMNSKVKWTMQHMGVLFDEEGIIRWPDDIQRELAPEKGFGIGLVDTRAWYRLSNEKGSFIIGISSGLSDMYVAGIFQDKPGRLERNIHGR